jgi:hypothetical protein
MGGPIIIWPPDVCDGAPGWYATMRDCFQSLLSLFWRSSGSGARLKPRAG